ncbi:MAG: hydantoinase/oxoprolinase family protein [Gammaproteobacteria bacterium]|nr:hydantoinase/oxoprolinase family protein [Gammaproteobacteria bacterium]
MIILGIDTGGTFTDFVLLQDNRLSIHKVLSTPAAPEQAILQGIAELGLHQLQGEEVYIIHGSTVATNAVLEGKGVRTAYITNRGLGDVLTIGRQARRELYNLQPVPQPPPVPPELCLETGGRLAADGQVVEPLSEDDLLRLRQSLHQLAPRSVAINMMFAFLDDRFEKRIAAAVPEGIFVSRSSQVLPEYKEYERGIATWLNASVGPIVQGYLSRLFSGLTEATQQRASKIQVSVMQSYGGTMDIAQAGEQAVQLLLSGPAGGLAGAKYVGELAGRQRLLSFDMGGTSTDVALIDGDIVLTNEGRIGDYPVAIPMVDMHTIGAGGGSIATVDAGGLLQVGPQSAGADPGPACYGKGGRQATVTDANVVLGRLRPDRFLGGKMSLDEQASFKAVEALATPLNMDVVATATGIINIVNEHMARALRVMSVQKGIDPRQLTLTCFGGAGGLHVCALAEALDMTQAMVPIHAGVLSALGMLAAPRARHLSRTLNSPLAEMDAQKLEAQFLLLEQSGSEALSQEGVAAEDIQRLRSVDLRYKGQSYTLNVPWQNKTQSEQLFHQLHEQRYGHRLVQPLELVTARVKLSGSKPDIPLNASSSTSRNTARPLADQSVALPGIGEQVSVYSRENLPPEHIIKGPALITETVSTTFLAANWECRVDSFGNLILSK